MLPNVTNARLVASVSAVGPLNSPHSDTKINYLIPIDVANADDEELWNYSINLNTLVENRRAQARAPRTMSCSTPAATSSTVAYATAPGRTASDRGTGGGTYAKALADEIVKPGVDSMLVFSSVARRVQHEIGQDPFLSASTIPEIYFAGASPSIALFAPALSPTSSPGCPSWCHSSSRTGSPSLPLIPPARSWPPSPISAASP